jgi:hypothetical protein
VPETTPVEVGLEHEARIGKKRASLQGEARNAAKIAADPATATAICSARSVLRDAPEFRRCLMPTSTRRRSTWMRSRATSPKAPAPLLLDRAKSSKLESRGISEQQ